ncbi:MAG: hypothetical protein M3Q16_03995 [Pseudomonadota bacterium]|nr:hypothetical protein [Pseudomonadota bacterium]
MTFRRDKDGYNAVSVEALAAQALAAGLVYVSNNEPGIRRLRRGRGFRYVGSDEKALTDKAELERIAKLAIPPAYTDVWICVHAQGHLQATGLDARKRKQYRIILIGAWRGTVSNLTEWRNSAKRYPGFGCVCSET